MSLEPLRGRIRGELIEHGSPGFEPACRNLLFNAIVPDRRPDAIVRPANADDVAAAMRFADQHGLRVGVSSGGHNWVGAPLRRGGLLLDLSRLTRVEVDASRKLASAEPCVRAGDLSRLLATQRLAFPVGHCPVVALGGFLLAGGFGWNSGAWGPACFSVTGIEAVTAAGEVITPNDPRHADFLWAARGGGAGFFGVVTRFHLALQPLPAAIVSNTYVFPLEAARDVAALITKVAGSLPSHVELTFFLCPPPTDFGGRERISCVVTATAFCTRTDEIAPALAAVEGSELATSSIAKIERQNASHEVLFAGMNRLFPERHRYLSEALWVSASLEDTVAAAVDCFRRAPSSRSVLLCLLPPPPPPGAPPPPEAAFSMSASTFAGCYSIWDDAAQDGVNTAWHRELVGRIETFAVGYYIGESDIAARPDLASRCFSPAAWERLGHLRRQYDPRGRMHGFFAESD